MVIRECFLTIGPSPVHLRCRILILRAQRERSRWKDDIAEEVKQDRLKRLLTLQQEIHTELLQEMLGTEVEVLVNKPHLGEESMKGRTRCWKNVAFSGSPALAGTLQRVKITGYSNQTLIGTL